MRELDSQVIADCVRVAGEFGVPPNIHPKDFIFWFVHDHPSFQANKTEAVNYYFANGLESAKKVEALVRQYGGKENPSILEFAAGYGCVTRHLKGQLPGSRITACDIHDDALAFLGNELGAATLRSAHVPEELNSPQTFDVVFALSFFSHMPNATWQRWVKALARRVTPGGLLFFTTNGEASMQVTGADKLDEEGYWFIASSEQADLDGSEYGSTVTSFAYAYREIAKTRELHLLRFDEAFWYNHQDVYVLRRTNV